MCLRICVPFVVKKARVKTNVLGFKVNSERGRASYGSVICDYTAWLGSLFSVTCTLCNLVPREAFKRERADYTPAAVLLYPPPPPQTELSISFS